MKKLYIFPAFLLVISMVFQSCSKQSTTETVAPMNGITVSATIAPNGSYQLPIDNSGSISISMQASHYQVSQTEVDSKSGFVVYKYVPAADYRGTDEVVISTTKASTTNAGGCPNNNHTESSASAATYSTSYTIVKINITNN